VRSTIIFTFLILFVANNDYCINSNEQVEVSLKCFACDSTGTPKTMFNLNETQYFGCTITNISMKPIVYTRMQFNPLHIVPPNKVPRLEDLFSLDCTEDSSLRPPVMGEENSPPPGTTLLEFTLNPEETLSQVVEYSPYQKMPVGIYCAWFWINCQFQDGITTDFDDEHLSVRFRIVNTPSANGSGDNPPVLDNK